MNTVGYEKEPEAADQKLILGRLDILFLFGVGWIPFLVFAVNSLLVLLACRLLPDLRRDGNDAVHNEIVGQPEDLDEKRSKVL